MELKQHEINQLLEQLEKSREAQNSPIYKKLKEEQVRKATTDLFDIPGSDYWIVMHDPDLTEGNCYYAMDFIITQWTGFPASSIITL